MWNYNSRKEIYRYFFSFPSIDETVLVTNILRIWYFVAVMKEFCVNDFYNMKTCKRSH